MQPMPSPSPMMPPPPVPKDALDEDQARRRLWYTVAALLLLLLMLLLLIAWLLSTSGGGGLGMGGGGGGTTSGQLGSGDGQSTAESTLPPSSMGNTPGTSSGDNPQPKPDASSPTDSKSGSGNAPDAAPGDTPGGLEEGLTIFNPTEDSKPALPATVNSDRPPTSGTAGAGQGVQSIDAGGSNPFIGSGPPAKSTIYVVDASDSMSGPRRQGRVNAALIRAIEQLKPDQRFKVYFFATQYYTDNIGSGLIGATSKNKQKVIAWINQIGTHGGTHPLPAMLEALKLNPERIVLMSDGEFDPTSVPIITKANKKTKIDCAGMVEVVETLKQIATENKGIYYQVN